MTVDVESAVNTSQPSTYPYPAAPYVPVPPIPPGVPYTQQDHRVNYNYVTNLSGPTIQDIRIHALREAISYFAYVARQAPVLSGPTTKPVGALTVLGMAEHFAEYIKTGTMPTSDDEAT